jgi:uncharacterized protein YndB with AHSA1/START domain
MATRNIQPTEEPTRDVVITRLLNAPRELVWKAWTEPERLKLWWGPTEFTTPTFNIDLRVGGKFLFCMRSPEGQDYWGTGEYREIVPPSRLVYTDNFADEKGAIVPASHYGMQGVWASPLLVTVTLEDQGGKTKMTLRHQGIPAGEMGEMTSQGWSGSFDKLAALLQA